MNSGESIYIEVMTSSLEIFNEIIIVLFVFCIINY